MSEVLQVRGAPALVTEPHGRFGGQVMVVEGGTLIRVIGNGSLPAEALIWVAESVR